MKCENCDEELIKITKIKQFKEKSGVIGLLIATGIIAVTIGIIMIIVTCSQLMNADTKSLESNVQTLIATTLVPVSIFTIGASITAFLAAAIVRTLQPYRTVYSEILYCPKCQKEIRIGFAKINDNKAD